MPEDFKLHDSNMLDSNHQLFEHCLGFWASWLFSRGSWWQPAGFYVCLGFVLPDRICRQGCPLSPTLIAYPMHERTEFFACLQNFRAVCFFCHVCGKVPVKHVVGIENRKLLPQLSCPIFQWSNGSQEASHGRCASRAKWFQIQWSEVIQILSNLPHQASWK